MSKINTQELALLLQEASALSNKPNWTKQDERRNAYLLAAISAVKEGVSLEELDQEQHNAAERRAGLPVTNFKRGLLTPEQRQLAKEWQGAVLETRTGEVGNPIPRIGTYNTSGGTFVPTEFFNRVFQAMAPIDPLMDENDVTLIKSTNGRPITVPVLADIENVAQVIGESVQDSSTDLASVGQAVVGAFSFRTPRFTASIESFQDVEAAGGMASLFESFASSRLARGISNKLLQGAGTTEPLGLVPSIIALASTATPIVTAIGAGSSTGLPSLGVGVEDLSSLYFSVNAAYRASPKCAWLMCDDTLRQLSAVVTKEGLPLVNIVDGVSYLYGRPVKVSPSMQIISNGNYPVLFGDLSYWCSRLIVDEASYIKLIFEAPGLVEQGLMAARAYMRSDGALAFTSQTDPSPMNLLRCAHS